MELSRAEVELILVKTWMKRTRDATDQGFIAKHCVLTVSIRSCLTQHHVIGWSGYV